MKSGSIPDAGRRQRVGFTQPFRRPRWMCALLIAFIVPLGLATRALPWLPAWIREHGGDALWAAMVYWGWALLFPRWPAGALALAAMALSAGIESSQLWHHPLLQQARSTRFGALVLGHGFLWIDLVRYAGGVALATVADVALATGIRRAGGGNST